MIFKKSNNTVFNSDNVEIEIVKNFIYLGIIHMYLALVALFPQVESALSGQALK